MPLPKWGQYMMGLFYFSVPVVGGLQVMQWAISKSHESIGERGEKLQQKEIHGIGDQTYIDGKKTKIGAGGLGMGVHLSISDQDTQLKNKKMLENLFRKERKRRKKKVNSQDENQE